MKKLLLLLIATIGISSAATAQEQKIPKWGEDSVKCFENLYIYYELAKQRNYMEAYEPWRYVFDNCPGSSINNFIYGARIAEAKVKEAETDSAKTAFAELLMDVYDKRLQYFPGKEAYVKERKALDMIQHMPDSTQKAYQIFEEARELDKEHSAAFYNGYFIAAARLFNEDVFDIGDVFRAYNVVMEGMEHNTDQLHRENAQLREKEEAGTLSSKEEAAIEKNERELERYQDVASNIEKILGPIATCDKLQLIYNEETFEANKEDPQWLRRAAKMLTRERENEEGEEVDCTDNPIFIKVAEALYEQEPSPTAARAVATIAMRNNNDSKAVDYLKEAANQEVDPNKKAGDWLRIANLHLRNRRLADAKSAAMKSSSLRKNWGRPYLILAQVYAQADGQCGNNVFEKKAVYWAAIEKLQYAKSIDNSVASRANRLIEAYKQQLPDKSASFQLGYTQGDTHQIECFVNESITADWNL